MPVRLILSFIGGTWLGPAWEPQTRTGRAVQVVARAFAVLVLLAVALGLLYVVISALTE